MDQTKKIAMFSNGTAVVNDNGSTRKASQEEIKDYLLTLVPQKYKDNDLSAIKYDDGYVYAKYEGGKTFRKRIAQTSDSRQTEPVNSGDKADPDLKVPRNEKKSKPEVDSGDDSAKNPTKIRKDEYERGGDKAKNLHTDVVPRSEGNSGLAGGKKTTFDKENANDATSGNPDKYVQDTQKNTEPAKAGSEKNHTASNEIEMKSGSEIYQKIKLAKEEEEDEKEDKKDKKNKEEKDDKKSLPPWLEKGKKDEDKKEEKDEEKDAKAEAQTKLAQAEKEIEQLKKEIETQKIKSSRQKEALKLALCYRDINPEKYASADVFADKVDEIAKKMNLEAIKTAVAEIEIMRKEAMEQRSQIKTASLVIPQKTYDTYADTSTQPTLLENLKQAIISHTKLGQQVAEYETYQSSERR